MIKEFLLMNGHGIYVWSAFIFTLFSFTLLYALTKIQYVKEKKKFIAKFGTLNPQRAAFAKTQSINRSILSNISKI